MQTMTANQAKTQFGAFIDMAQKEPVRVMRHDRVVGVMVSASDYEAMRAFDADRLARTLDQTAAQAAAAGLTQEQLDALGVTVVRRPGSEPSGARSGGQEQAVQTTREPVAWGRGVGGHGPMS